MNGQASKAKAFVEALIAESAFFLVAWLLQTTSPNSYGWASKLFMALLALEGILIHRTSTDYSLRPKNTRYTIKWSALILALFLAPTVTVILGAELLNPQYRPDLANILTMLSWYYVFVGFAEELFFRGYIQTRLNEAFTKKYRRVLGIEYQWTQGTLVTGIFFFGLPHLLTGINPFTGTYRIGALTVAITVFASFLGVVFGVIKEKTGSIVVPTVLHGSIDFTVYSLAEIIGITYSNALAFTLLFIFFATCLEKMLKEPV